MMRLDAADLAPQGGWDQASFRVCVRIYESTTEPIARMVGVLGRWGDDSEFPLVLDIIRSLYAYAEKVGNGLTTYLNIRSYPAVLAFTAYRLGLTRAERWGALHRLFSAVILPQYKKPIRAVAGGEEPYIMRRRIVGIRKGPVWGPSDCGVQNDSQESLFLFTKPSGKLACFACPAARR
jgi:hypothetical protein